MLQNLWMAVILAMLAGGAAFLAGAARPGAAAAGPVTPPTPVSGDAKRGEFLVTVAGCNDCHTPMKLDPELGMPVPDFSRAFSGHPQGAPDPQGTLGAKDQALIGPTFTAFRLPFGVAYASNLTPDPSGLGAWTEAQFVKAMRTGRHVGEGRPILPPMPWMMLGQLPDEDLRAIWAYLRTVPPVKNTVPAAKVDEAAVTKLGQAYEKLQARMKAGGGR